MSEPHRLDDMQHRAIRALGDEPDPVGDGHEYYQMWIDHQRTMATESQQDSLVLIAALRAVMAVHEPVDAAMYGPRNIHKVKVCTGCGQDDGNWNQWPCPTVEAINRTFKEQAA